MEFKNLTRVPSSGGLSKTQSAVFVPSQAYGTRNDDAVSKGNE